MSENREFCEYRFHEPLNRHTSFKIGGCARIFVQPKTIRALLCALQNFQHAKLLAKGTNVLAPDEGVESVVSTLGLNRYKLNGELIESEPGVLLSTLCKAAAREGLSGLEFAYGIPGTIGGAVYMNAGAYGGEIGEVVEYIEVYDGNEIFRLDRSQMEFSYRSSIVKRTGWVILKVVLRLRPADREKIEKTMEEIMKRRISTQPLDLPSAGSVFKRPRQDFYVGKAIEELGLKGFRIGDAQISTKHAGFIVNLGNAKASDVKQLIEVVQKKVYESFAIQLEPEVEIW
ncbi:MAG: UDP-N-acetylmuramate dehydrogenase [Pseudothermotoga sp.]